MQIQGKQGLVRDIGRFGKPRVQEIGIPLYLISATPITFIIKLMSGKNFLFGKYSFIKKYAAKKAYFKTDISVSFSSTISVEKRHSCNHLGAASKALLWRPDFLYVSIACDLNQSDATPENLSVLFWGFVTPCFGCFVTFINKCC